jgi:5-methyltetrahydropteroyltriglutamate--homocysteine methyltransferase
VKVGKIETSVIGSYPMTIDTLKIMRQYFTQKPTDCWRDIISEVVDDMLQAGLTIISDGQTRDPFIQLFTRQLKGCRIRARTEIIDTIEFQEPITVSDQQFVRSITPQQIKIKGVITGPWTLTNSCVDHFYHDQHELAQDFALALSQEAKSLEKYVDFLSIDEPFFSQNIPDYASELITTISKRLQIPTILHICGNMSQMVPKIIDLPVDILSHEFKASPHVLSSFAQYSFTQQICLGAVRSDTTQVETVKEILNHIQQAYELFGSKIVQIAPDCGQRLLPRHVAFKKLINLVRAGERFNAG